MDNITHSLIGFAAGQGVVSVLDDDREKRLSTLALLTSVLANNAPDGDVILGPLLGEVRMGNLLHHRGFTHTVLAAPFLGALAALLAVLIFKRRKTLNRGDWLTLTAIGVLGVCLHITADSWNDYGVHPWAPFHNRWYYGDMLFIMEPLLWIALLWPLSERKIAWQALLLLSLGLLWFYPGLTWPVGLLGTAWAALCMGFFRFVKAPLLRLLPMALVLLAFGFGSRAAKQAVARNLSSQLALAPHPYPGFEEQQTDLVDVLVSPSPGNPWCYRTVAGMFVGTPGAQIFFTHLGFASLWPGVFPPATCHVRRFSERTAQLSTTTLLPDRNVFWLGSYANAAEDYKELAEKHCGFAQFLRFARFPFIMKEQSGALVYGDHRYDFDQTLGFAEFREPAGEAVACPKLPVSWRPRFYDRLMSQPVL